MSPKLYDIPVEGEAYVVARIGEKAFVHQWDLALDAHSKFLLELIGARRFPGRPARWPNSNCEICRPNERRKNAHGRRRRPRSLRQAQQFSPERSQAG